MMTGINLLPWRKTAGERKKKMKFYLLTVALAIGLIAFGIDYCIKNKKPQQLKKPKPVELIIHHKTLEIKDVPVKHCTEKIGQESLDSLHYIGTIRSSRTSWALISQSSGLVSTINAGDCLGKEHGRVVDIKDNAIQIEKSWLTGTEFSKKIITMHLRS